MKYLPKGSLRSYLAIPQVKAMNLSSYPCSEAAKRVKAYWDTAAKKSDVAYPEKEAISFYALNHMAAIIQSHFDMDEVLPEWAQDIMEMYVQSLAEQGKRLYAYILLIITRESRHMHTWKTQPADVSSVWSSFHSGIKGGDSITVAKTFCISPPNMTLGDYVANVEQCFFKGSFSGGYGGKPWGNIARCLRRMLFGETSIATLVDTAYTLAHNNGPMFNKGMLYHTYNHNGTLLKILDIQRAGQIPEAILSGALPSNFINSEVTSHVQKVKSEFPEAFGDAVDWNVVEEYAPAKQKGKYAYEKAQMPEKVAPPKIVHGKKWVPVATLKVMPNVAVTTMKREAA